MDDKITLAVNYCTVFGWNSDNINDASNIFAENFVEYGIIWRFLNEFLNKN